MSHSTGQDGTLTYLGTHYLARTANRESTNIHTHTHTHTHTRTHTQHTHTADGGFPFRSRDPRESYANRCAYPQLFLGHLQLHGGHGSHPRIGKQVSRRPLVACGARVVAGFRPAVRPGK